MKLLATITEQDINAAAPVVDSYTFDRREAVRAVVMNAEGKIALLYVSNRRFHKLPGGGIESGESRVDALNRETFEEIGCHIKILNELGKVVEYRDQWQQVQTSFCYLAKQVGDQQQSSFTDAEQRDGFAAVWANDIDNAIALLTADKPAGYDGQRMVPRDLAILKAAKAV